MMLKTFGMSKETLEFHHDLHHKAYVDNGNKPIAGTEWESKSVEDIIMGTYNDEAAQNEFSTTPQHWNYTQFWQMIGPNGKTMPTVLENEISNNFDFEKFKEESRKRAGAGQFGSAGVG